MEHVKCYAGFSKCCSCVSTRPTFTGGTDIRPLQFRVDWDKKKRVREKRKKGRRESVKCNRCYGEKGRDRKKMTWKWDERESGWMINFFLCCARGIGNGLVRY